jgi:thiamine biosynthesis lipoprotein
MPSISRFLPVLGCLVLANVPAWSSSFAAGAEPPPTRAELVMGTIGRITLGDREHDAAFEAGFAAFRRVDASMSLYHPESDVVRVNVHAAAHAEPVDPEVFACLARARALSDATDGAFDVTVLPLLRAWGAYPGLAYLPSGRVDAVGWGGLLLDPVQQAVRLRAPAWDRLGGIAKGFALDRARAALVAAGARDAILDLAATGARAPALRAAGASRSVTPPTRREPRPSSRSTPMERVSTSGNYERDFATEGWRTPSHVFDPRTGRPVRGGLAVTVWAPDATTADALSTALLVLGPADAAETLRRAPEVGALFVDDDRGERRVTLAGRPPRAFEPRTTEPRVAGPTTEMENSRW